MSTRERGLPLEDPSVSIFLITSNPVPSSRTFPHTTCCPSSQGVSTCATYRADEELRVVCILAAVGHADAAKACVSSGLPTEALVGELLPIDRFTPCSVPAREVSALAHEILDDPVEIAPLPEQGRHVTQTGARYRSLSQSVTLKCSGLPHLPMPRSPVHSARKFSAVLGTASA
eukprot:scaffold2093_cov425-Prasinococcus_capsulatus_cf.AAC.17